MVRTVVVIPSSQNRSREPGTRERSKLETESGVKPRSEPESVAKGRA